jgi:SAM-dependent methyltransferase
LYGIERDQFIVQAKAVVNAHFYESSRFEQARVAHCLSLGTPVISELTAQTRPHRAFDASVLWLQGSELEDFFTRDFATPAYFELMRAALERFTHADPINDYATVLAYATGFVRAHFERRSAAPWQPARINLGSGKDYKSGWLNLDVLERTEPDLVLDLSSALTLPLVIPSRTGATLRLEADSVDLIHANNVLEHVADLPALMGNCLRLLKLDGEFHIEVPYEHAATAWQDPTHVRAMNENSWIYYTDWFWYLGWFEHRYALKTSCYLNRDLAPCEREHAAFMRVVLRKVATTLRERMTARTLQADPGLPEDRVEPGQAFRWEPTDSRAQPLAA